MGRMGKLVGVMLMLASGVVHGQTPGAGIVGTWHDTSVWYTSNQVCIMCHAPHNTNAQRPLWNHALSEATYTLYASATMNAVAGQPGPKSKLCLSCHDGTVGISDWGGSPVGPGGYQLGPGDGGYIGTDLTISHPIGITYDSALAASDGKLSDPATKTVTIGSAKSKSGTIAAIMLADGKVECTSCHDVHNIYTVATSGGLSKNLVKVSLTGSLLCLQCHVK